MRAIQGILDIAKAKQKHGHDSVFIIAGLEGIGKSTLELWAHEYLKGKQANICLDKEDMFRALGSIEDKEVLSFDEAGDGLFSRDFSSNVNKTLVKTFMIIRAKRLITFLVLPSFFLLDVYFRRHRVRGLFYVYRRGRVMFFDREQIQKIIAIGEKYQKISGTKPLFYDNFPNYKGVLLEEYLKKKDIKIKETLKNLQATMKVRGGTIREQIHEFIKAGKRTTDIAKILNIAPSDISRERRYIITGGRA